MDEIYKPHEVTITNSDGDKLSLTIHWDANIYEWQDAFKVILKWLTFHEDQVHDIFCDDDCELKNQEEMKDESKEDV